MSSRADLGTDPAPTAEWQRPTAFYNHTVKYLAYVGLALFVLWSIWGIDISLDRFLFGIQAGIDLVDQMVPPETAPRYRELIFSGAIETLAMSIVATILGVIVSLPIAFLAARNLAPLPVYLFGRGLITISRSFHSLVFAIVAVKAFGFGPFAGVVTLVFATVGFFSKLLAEDLEDIDVNQYQAMQATGASRIQVILFGVIPQVMPRIVGLTIYRWDINIRAASIIGIVGAGGIGQTLIVSWERYDFAFSASIILVIVALVLAGEFISAYLRRSIQ